MTKLRSCSLRVAKKCSRLFVLLFFALLCLKGEAQDSASIILVPNGPRTYEKDLQLIARQLTATFSYAPDCPEVLDTCFAHGRMTFKKFFQPLYVQGLRFSFFKDSVRNTMLIVKRTETGAPKPIKRTFVVLVKDESGDPLSGVTVKNITTGRTVATDNLGLACFEYDEFPVELFLTYIDRRSASVTILKDSSSVFLPIDPQSLEIATVSCGGIKKAMSPGTSTTIQEDVASSYYSSPHRLSGISTGTIQTMLEGQIPGVLVTQSSGVPGSSSYLTVRGQSSIINGTDPLYIIDGVPSAGGNASVRYIQSGSAAGSLSPWSFISPSDIERIDVLRDGDATAIYGSRGANGVIFITTRRWKAGLPKWDVELSSGVSAVLKRPSFMNMNDYKALREEALENSGITPDSINAPDLKVLDTTRNVDWGKWLIGHTARMDNIKLATSGGEKRNNYTVGMNYLTEGMPFPTRPDHDRLTMNVNFNHLSRDRRWTLRITGLSGRDVEHQFTTDPTTLQNLAPNAPSPLDNSGGLNYPSGLAYLNPLTVIHEPYEAFSSHYLFSMVNSFRIINHLFCRTTVGIDHIQTKEFGETPLAAQNPAGSPWATEAFASTHLESRIFEPELEYKRKAGKLLIGWLGGASFQGSDQHAAAQTDSGYANDLALLHHDHAIPQDTSSQQSNDHYTAYYMDLYANWNDRYILDLNARMDRSSRFPAGHRSGDFGSISFGWLFSNTDLIHRVFKFVSYGKIKASEGVTGNNQIGDRTLQSISGTAIQPFQSIPELYPATPNGPGWEKTYKSEVSLDLGFLQNHLLFNATAYRHRSHNLLQAGAFSTIRSTYNTTSSPIVLDNSGLEFSLTAKLADNDHFSWDLSLNWTVPTSRLISFPQLSSSVYADRLIVGKSINVLKGYVYGGVDKQTGLYTFADLDHDGKITDTDQRVLGKFDVTGFGGFENTIRWKHFQFQLLIDARFATGVNYLATVFANNPPGAMKVGLSSNVPKALLDRWHHPGDNASYQKVYADPDTDADSTMNLYLHSSALFANTSFLRLRRLSIVYNLPPIKAMVLHLTSLSFFIDVQNLFVFSPCKVDAEIPSPGTMPTMRTIETGVRLTI